MGLKFGIYDLLECSCLAEQEILDVGPVVREDSVLCDSAWAGGGGQEVGEFRISVLEVREELV